MEEQRLMDTWYNGEECTSWIRDPIVEAMLEVGIQPDQPYKVPMMPTYQGLSRAVKEEITDNDEMTRHKEGQQLDMDKTRHVNQRSSHLENEEQLEKVVNGEEEEIVENEEETVETPEQLDTSRHGEEEEESPVSSESEDDSDTNVNGTGKREKGAEKKGKRTNSPTIPQVHCRVCDKAVAWKENRKRHIWAVHMGPTKAFLCNTCQYGSSHLSSVQRHIGNIHKPKTRRQSQALWRDQRGLFEQKVNALMKECFGKGKKEKTKEKKSIVSRQSKKRRIRCGQCPRSVQPKNKIHHALAKHSDIKPFICNNCAVRYAYKTSIRNHCAVKHLDQNCWTDESDKYKAEVDKIVKLCYDG